MANSIGATVVGLGIAASKWLEKNVCKQFYDTKYYSLLVYIRTYLRKDKCFTNGNGPEVFQKCASKWVAPNEKLNKWEKYNVQIKCTHAPPPSSYNKLCKAYYDKVESLR